MNADGEYEVTGYEVTLGPAAERAMTGLGCPRELVACLQTELLDGPNAHNQVEIWFDDEGNAVYPEVPGGVRYTALPLSFNGYTALHRPMTKDELVRLENEQDRLVADRGCYVVDILPAEAAFSRPRLA
jgi:hypothetical protein